MKSTWISREKNEVNFHMEFTPDDFEQALQNAYLATRGKYQVDGFRKGKAPRKLIEAKYGESAFYEDGIEKLFQDGYPKAVEELGLKPVDRPQVDFDALEKGKDFVIKVTVTVKPEVVVKDYKGVKVAKVEQTVSDEDVNRDLEALQKRNSRMVLVERPAKEGDTVLIDYAGFVGDHQFDGGTAERQPLKLGSNTFIPGFEEQLVGVSVGEEKDVTVTFPEVYHSEELAGKEAVFKVKVHEIKETELPELNDEFAKDVSEFDTLEELKQDTRAKLEKSAASKVEYDTKNAVLDQIYQANEIDIPEVMIQDQIDEMMEEMDQQMRYQGLDLQKYFEYMQKDVNEFRAEMRPDAEKRLKTRMLVEAVADAEQLVATEEDMEKELQAMADQYKMDLEKIKASMGQRNLALVENDIRMRKAIDFVFENAVIE